MGSCLELRSEFPNHLIVYFFPRCSDTIWLVVWDMNFIFPYSGNNHPKWLIFFKGFQTTSQLTDSTIFSDPSILSGRFWRPEDPVHVPYFQVGAGPPALQRFETLYWDAPIGHVGGVRMLGESCGQPCQKPRTTVLTLGTMIDWLSHNHRWLIPWEEIIDHPMLWLSSF